MGDNLPPLPPYIYGREAGENEKVLPLEQVRLYAEQAVKQEREQSAMACDQIAWSHPNVRLLGPELNATKCAAAIRARSSMESK